MYNEIKLPKSGIWVRVREGKGRHAAQAARLMDGDSAMYMPALMHQLVDIATDSGMPIATPELSVPIETTIKWEVRPMEWFLDELPLADYTELVKLMGN